MSKILKGAQEALRVAQGDLATIAKIRVTPSCGCVFCDVGLEPVEGVHVDARVSIPCTRQAKCKYGWVLPDRCRYTRHLGCDCGAYPPIEKEV